MDEHEDKSKKQEYEYRRKGSEDIAYPHNYIAGRGYVGLWRRGAFLFRRCVVWDLASMQSPQKPPQQAENARHEKPRHGKNRSYDHKGKVIAAGCQNAGGVFRGARIVFDADGPAHLDRVCQGAIFTCIMRSIHFIFVGHRIVDATPANFASVQLGNIRNVCAAEYPIRLLVLLNISIGPHIKHKEADKQRRNAPALYYRPKN